MPEFRRLVESYWQELMPRATIIRDPAQREAYFDEEFSWDGGNRHPRWAVVGDQPVGFLAFDLSDDSKSAFVGNFYVVPKERRKGYGTGMVRWLFSYLDALGVERIDLHVRRDNPGALAFWEAQGFGVAGYRMRQYRDPERGTAYVGALSSDT